MPCENTTSGTVAPDAKPAGRDRRCGVARERTVHPVEVDDLEKDGAAAEPARAGADGDLRSCWTEKAPRCCCSMFNEMCVRPRIANRCRLSSGPIDFILRTCVSFGLEIVVVDLAVGEMSQRKNPLDERRNPTSRLTICALMMPTSDRSTCRSTTNSLLGLRETAPADDYFGQIVDRDGT